MLGAPSKALWMPSCLELKFDEVTSSSTTSLSGEEADDWFLIGSGDTIIDISYYILQFAYRNEGLF